MLAVDPLVYEVDLTPGKPVWTLQEHEVRSLPAARMIRMAQVWFGTKWQRGRKRAGLPLRGADFTPRWVTLQPAYRMGRLAALPVNLPPLAGIERLRIRPDAALPAVSLKPREEMPLRPAAPAVKLDLALAPMKTAAPTKGAPAQREERKPQHASEPEVPTANRLFALLRPAIQAALGVASQRKSAIEPAPSLLQLIADPEHCVVKTTRFADLAGPKRMARPALPASLPKPAAGAVEPMSIQVDPIAQGQSQRIEIPPRPAGLAMGRGSRYPIEYRHDLRLGEQPEPVPAAPEVQLPGPQPAPALQADALIDAIVPPPAGLVALNVKLGGPVTKPIRALLLDVATIPQPPKTTHIIRPSGLEPLDEKPVSDQFEMDDRPAAARAFDRVAMKAHVWSQAARLWRVAPRDLKMLAFAIPALLALAFHRELPKVHVAAPRVATRGLSNSLHSVVNTQLTSVRQAVMDRAGVALDDDFRSGLDDWSSRGDATAMWSFDATGFVKPGPLALYRPSMNLSDYELQFLGMIDKKALSWVVRAADFDNYYVVKLEVVKPGPRTTLGLTRYAVINGKAVNRVDTPVQLEAQPDTLYRVGVDVEGENFSVTVQGQMVDSWTEPRLAHGGVGFFTSHGEESRIRWIAVRHQYDMLGRLCAYLAPYESPTNGSW